jgi:hypothetical protein
VATRAARTGSKASRHNFVYISTSITDCSTMPNSIPLEKLRQAIQAEQLMVKKSEQEYLALHAKMQAFQNGGPEPTAEDWSVWRQARLDIEAFSERQLARAATKASSPGASDS